MRALLSSCKSVLDAPVNLECSPCGVLHNLDPNLGQVSKNRHEAHVRELIAGNAILEAAAEPNPARAGGSAPRAGRADAETEPVR